MAWWRDLPLGQLAVDVDDPILASARRDWIVVRTIVRPDAPEIPDEDWKRLSEKTKAAGLWCLGTREEYGGGGLDTFSYSVVLEEMCQHRMGLYNPGCGVFGRPPAAFISSAKLTAVAVRNVDRWR